MKKLIVGLLVGVLAFQPPPALATETPDPEVAEHLVLADFLNVL